MCVYLRVTCDWFLNGSTKLTTHIGPVLLMKDWTYVCTQHIEQSSSFALCVVCTKLTHEVQPKQTGPSQNKQGPSHFGHFGLGQALLSCVGPGKHRPNHTQALLHVFGLCFARYSVPWPYFSLFSSVSIANRKIIPGSFSIAKN